MKKRFSKQGGALVMVLVVLLALTILSGGLFKLAEQNAIESIRETHRTQAFWIAESGLQQTLQKILTDKFYRNWIWEGEEKADDPDGVGTYQIDIDGAGQTGNYDLFVWREGANNYYIEVQAAVKGMKRWLLLEAKNLRPDLSYAIMTINGNARIKKDANIDGSIYSWGELWLFDGVEVLGDILAKDFKGSDDYDVTELDEEMEFEFDEEYYKDELQAASDASPLGGLGKALDEDIDYNLDLDSYDHDTLYVNGNVSIPNKIEGPGTLVINGNIDFTKNYSIDDNVRIILTGDFNAKKEGTLGTNVNVFAKGNGKISKATMSGEDGASSMIFIGNLTVDKEIDFSGLVYTGGNINFKKTTDIRGTVIAGGNFDMDMDSVITFDSNMIPKWVLDAIYIERFTTDNTWNELPSI